MNTWNGKSGGWIQAVTNMFILSALWIVFCLPVITAGPSTVAMFAVIREWQRDGNDSVVRSFFHLFRLHFKQGIIIGNIWIFSGVILTADLFFVLHMQTSWNIIPLSFIGLAIFLWVFTGTALFPCLIHYKKKGFSLVKVSFTLAFLDMQTTFAVLLLWVAGILMFITSPVFMIASFVLISYVHLRFSLRSFEQLESRLSLDLQHSAS